jgi:hypothetical protein
VLTGCFSSVPSDALSEITTSATPTPSPTLDVAGGKRAVRIIFSQSSKGSFEAPSAGGTPPGAGSGLQAQRIFETWNDGSGNPVPIASAGPSGADWPAWVKNVEIGISGAANSAQTNADCARFAAVGESTAAQCDFNNDGLADTDCGAPDGLYRVSEYDCGRMSPEPTGDGSSGDGVYIRVDFDRTTTSLGSSENVLAVLRYSAATVNSGATDPTKCFTSGTFTPTATGCADFVWQSFIKTTSTDTYTPFLMLVPPAPSHVDTTGGTSGATISTKQFLIPLASWSALTEFQISRVKGMVHGGTFDSICNGAAASSNSPLCAGMVFYSLNLYRI